MSEALNIYQKLIECRKAVPYLQKEAKGHQYNYVSSSQVLASVRAKMDELGLLLIPRVTDKRVAVDGKNIFTELDMTFTWVNADKPEEVIECAWYGQGMDISGEKGVGKAMTYAEKYFLLKSFNIATDKDDPDSFQGKHDNVTPIRPETPTNEDGEKMMNDSQRKALGSACKAKGIDQAALFNLMKAETGKEHPDKLTFADASKLLAVISKQKGDVKHA